MGGETIMKKALITGALGQDGSYMAEYLLGLNYEVIGMIRGQTPAAKIVKNYVKGVTYKITDMRDTVGLENLIRSVHPDEIYNFAGQVFVPTSWTHPSETFDVNTNGLARILAVTEKVCPSVRIYQASSSEMYGNILKPRSSGVSTSTPIKLDEDSPMQPVSPYAVSKLAAHKLVSVYRRTGRYVVSGIAFNHESPRRGSEMVTRKITKHIASVKAGKTENVLRLGEPDSRRDWGFAGDYVKAMHASLQQKIATDYVIGTGTAHSVKQFVEKALEYAGISCGVEYYCGEFMRFNELNCLVADITKVTSVLQWAPEHSFQELVQMMVDSDYNEYMKTNEEEMSHV